MYLILDFPTNPHSRKSSALISLLERCEQRCPNGSITPVNLYRFVIFGFGKIHNASYTDPLL